VTTGRLYMFKQGVALTGRNRTGPPSVSAVRPPTRPAAGAPTVYALGGRSARTPAALKKTTTPTDDSVQNNTVRKKTVESINLDADLAVGPVFFTRPYIITDTIRLDPN